MVFGFVWLDDDLIVYDICEEALGGRPGFVASLSADPQVRFAGARPEQAASQLIAHMQAKRLAATSRPPRLRVTWSPQA